MKAVPSTSSAPADATDQTRADLILAAACRVIARVGTREARLQDIAAEANVSKTLIHYYFKSRQELLAQAYMFADKRARGHVYEAIASVSSASVRLRQLLRLYFEDQPEVTEDWTLWSELSTNAAFDPELRPIMEKSYKAWVGEIAALVEEAVSEGSLPPDIDPVEVAQRLTAVIDGLGLAVVRGLITLERARTLLDASLAFETAGAHRDAGAQSEAAPAQPAPATGYLRLVARLLADAVAELEPLADNADEDEAIRTVRDLIGRAAGGAVARLDAGHEFAATPDRRPGPRRRGRTPRQRSSRVAPPGADAGRP